MNTGRDTSLALTKQRRLLVVMSLTVVAYYALGAHIEGEASYSGIALAIGRPQGAVYFLWIIWGWSLLRYWQRFYELLADVRKEILENVHAEDRRLAVRAARRQAVREARAGRIGEGYSNVRVHQRTIDFVEPISEVLGHKSGEPAPVPEPEYVPTSGGGRKYRYLSGSFFGRNAQGGYAGGSFELSMEWGLWRTRWHVLRSWIAATWRLPGMTEYMAPLLIAALSLVVSLAFLVQGQSTGPDC